MIINVVTITPEMAKEWLKQNVENRRVREAHVSRLCTAITSGEWKLTGDPIRFSGKRLIDGQHRLLAIVKANQSIESVVITDLADEAFDYIDQGMVRESGDIVAAHGFAYATTLATMIRILAAYDKGGALLHMQTYEKLSSAEIIRRITPSHVQSAAFGAQNTVKRVLTPSLLGVVHFITSQINGDLAATFWREVCQSAEPSDLYIPNAFLLRDRLLTHAAQNKRMSLEHKFTWCVRAWNCTRCGIELQKNGLKFVAGDPIPRFE